MVHLSRARVADPWPWPGDDRTQRARRVALAALIELRKADPAACDKVEAAAVRMGETWVQPKRGAIDLDELLTATQAADYADVKPRTIDTWRSRGLKVTNTPDGPRYRWGDVLDYRTEVRRRLAGRTQRPPP